MSLRTDLHRALMLPLPVVIRKTWRRMAVTLPAAYARVRDQLVPTYTTRSPSLRRNPPLPPEAFPVETLRELGGQIAALTERYLAHTFDLLGSGWVTVRHGMEGRGLEGLRYSAGAAVGADAAGMWLAGRISRPNLRQARAIWGLVDAGYIPIDWQIDFRSGYRWSERTWFRDIAYGHRPGADVKVPWELARMQHLPQLAWAAAASAQGVSGLRPAAEYAAEFRNEVLDFAATNPPRFGVNWASTMDAAIRAVNWLVAFWLFEQQGITFDEPFREVFSRSLYEHGRHVAAHLEWDPSLRGNHYLSNIVGLLFIAAWLPGSGETEQWLAFAAREFLAETGLQFGPDGANFEASTSYHRLSAEMVLCGAALLVRLLDERPGARLPAPPDDWLAERLDGMRRFTLDASGPGGQVVQVGDNDSGRFLKVHPDADPGAVLDHRHLVAGITALVPDVEAAGAAWGRWLDQWAVTRLSGGRTLRPPRAPGVPGRLVAPPRAYPDFGLYIYRAPRVYLAVRCGPVGQRGHGGHAHNDQLSFTLCLDDVPVVVDPGTYVYTPLPERRNRFRSTAMHATLHLVGREQNPWPAGRAGLFALPERSRARAVTVTQDRFEGVHHGFGPAHRRTLTVREDGVAGIDECEAPGERAVTFPLAPRVRVDAPAGEVVHAVAPGLTVRFEASPGEWIVEPALYSPAYGVVMDSWTLRLRATAPRIAWSITVVEGRGA